MDLWREGRSREEEEMPGTDLARLLCLGLAVTLSLCICRFFIQVSSLSLSLPLTNVLVQTAKSGGKQCRTSILEKRGSYMFDFDNFSCDPSPFFLCEASPHSRKTPRADLGWNSTRSFHPVFSAAAFSLDKTSVWVWACLGVQICVDFGLLGTAKSRAC
jgi:hypothetical protein